MIYKSQSDLYLEDNISKYPAIELLCKLGYQYISPEECVAQRGGLYDVILKDVLRAQLHKLINQLTSQMQEMFIIGFNKITSSKLLNRTTLPYSILLCRMHSEYTAQNFINFVKNIAIQISLFLIIIILNM